MSCDEFKWQSFLGSGSIWLHVIVKADSLPRLCYGDGDSLRPSSHICGFSGPVNGFFACVWNVAEAVEHCSSESFSEEASNAGSRSETPSSAILSRVNSEGCCLVNPLELVVEIYSIYTPTQTLVARRHTPAGHTRRYPHLAPLRICHIYIVFTRLPVSVLIIFSHGRMWNSVFMHLLE